MGVGEGGLTPLVPLNHPKFVLTPEKIVKISQKYIADPPPPLAGFPTNRVYCIRLVYRFPPEHWATYWRTCKCCVTYLNFIFES